MKIFAMTIVLLAAIALVPTTSYAIIDGEVFGGGFWGGKADNPENTKTSGDIDWGYQYGWRLHVNTGMPIIPIKVGLGWYQQWAPLNIKFAGTEIDLDRRSRGFDGYLELTLIPIIHPYVRGGLGYKDTYELKYPAGSVKYTKYWNSHYTGVGLALSFVMIQIYGEYLYTTSKVSENSEMKGNAFNLGAKLSL